MREAHSKYITLVEVFKWVAGPWSTCSIPCGDGIRRRRVDCFAVIEDTSSLDYPVYDDHCLNEEKVGHYKVHIIYANKL